MGLDPSIEAIEGKKKVRVNFGQRQGETIRGDCWEES